MSSTLTKKDLQLELEEFLASAGYTLDEEGHREVIKLLKECLRPSVEGDGIAPTKDGSFTLIHQGYGEPYHSLSAGAITECLEKFVQPSELLTKAQKAKVLRVIDLGFGLGYNMAVLIKKLRDINKRVQIEILSFEKELPKEVPPPPEEYMPYWRLLWENLPQFEKEGINFQMLLGDARGEVQRVKDFQADAIFHDAFSPYKNPELWSLDFLRELIRLLKPDGVWISYTSSLAVRKALKLLGLNLQSTKSVGRKRGGTRAGFLMEENLSEEEIQKLKTSPYAIPFLDKNLSRKPLHILLDYLVRVYNSRKIPKEVVL